MSERDVAAAVAQLRAGVDALLGAPVDGLAATELASVLEAVEVQRRRLEAVDQRLLAAASTAGVAAAFGQAGVADVLTSLLRIDPREARARVGRAVDLGPRRALTGERLEPLLPVTADAVAAGAVSAAQVEVIVECLERIPPGAPAAAGPVAERLLVEAARFEAPRQLRRTAAELLTRLDPDGLEPVEDRADRRRSFTLVKKPDGTSSPRAGPGRRRSPRCGRRSWTPSPPRNPRRTGCRTTGPRASGGRTRWPTPPPGCCARRPCRRRAGRRSPCWPPPPSPTSPPPPPPVRARPTPGRSPGRPAGSPYSVT